MIPTYQPSIVALSILIAIFVSYTVIGVGSRIVIAPRAAVKYWLIGGSFAMGTGIWAMHFIGMLAFHLPIPLAYDPLITLLSMVPAVLASAIALFMMRVGNNRKIYFIFSALLMGAGISTMHYTGMAALKMHPAIQYNTSLFILSILIAVIASGSALLIVYYHQKKENLKLIHRMISSIIMGIAIAGMHYTGMAAAEFLPDSMCIAAQESGFDTNVLIILVSVVSISVLSIAIVFSFVDKIRNENFFYQALLSAQSELGVGVVIIDNDEAVFFNPAMVQLSGYTKTEMNTLFEFHDLFIEQDRDKAQRLFMHNQVGHNVLVQQELNMMTKQGEKKTVEVGITNFSQSDRILQLLILKDISDSKKVLYELQQQQAESEKLARVAAYTDNAVIITDAQGLVEWVNEGFTRITGYSPTDIIGKKPGRILQGKNTDPETVREIKHQLTSGSGFYTEIINYSKSGKEYWLSINIQPIYNKHGEIEQFIAVESDITDKKLAEDNLIKLNQSLEQRVLVRTEELEQQRKFVESIFDTTGSLIVLLDLSFRIFRANETWKSIFKNKNNELPPQYFHEYLVEEQHKQLDKILSFTRLKQESVTAEFSLKLPNEEIKDYAWNLGTIKSKSGEVEYIVLTGNDITERNKSEGALKKAYTDLSNNIITLKETQDELVQSQKMASLGGLVAGISHEINTPIGIGVTSATTIQECVEDLALKLQNGTMKKSDLDEFVEHIRRCSLILLKNLQRSSELISSFKQVAVDQSSDTAREINFHEYIDEIITSMHPKWKNTSITILNNTDQHLECFTYPGAIYQIISNLINNSLIHGFDTGDMGKIIITAVQHEQTIRLSYSDTGKGIPIEYQNKIFDPFFTTRRGSGGSGLGLNIVYNLITSTLKGRIELSSNEKKGTTFLIVFPMKHEELSA